MKSLLSRKLWMTLIAFALVWFAYERAVNHLYAMPTDAKVSALTTIFVAVLSVLGVIVAAYLGTNALQARFGINAAASVASETVKHIVERTPKASHFDEPEI